MTSRDNSPQQTLFEVIKGKLAMKINVNIWSIIAML